MIDRDYNEYMLYWRKTIDRDKQPNARLEKLCLIAEIEPHQIIDALIMDHGIEFVIQFIIDISIAYESAELDSKLAEYFNSITKETREW